MREAALSFGVTLALTPIVIAWLHRQRQLDVPNERSSHVRPTPRGGGISVGAGALIALAASPHFGSNVVRGVALSAAVFGAIGFADDLRSMPAKLRLGLQGVAALVALPWLLAGMHGNSIWRLVFVLGCAAWIVAYVNAFNFMDGINGISAGQTIVAGITWVIVAQIDSVESLATVGAVIAAATAAFGPFNFPTARVFLGDVGSYFIGAWLAAGVIVGLRAGVTPEAMLAPLGLYLTDTSTTIVRRVRAGEVWYVAHRSHTYQRLARGGRSNTRTTALVVAMTAICGALGLVSLGTSLLLRVAADMAVVAVLVAYLRAPALARGEPRS